MQIAGSAAKDAQLDGAWVRSKLMGKTVDIGREEKFLPNSRASRFTQNQLRGAVFAFVVGTGGLLTATYIAERGDRGYRIQDFEYKARLGANVRIPQIRGTAENLARVREGLMVTITDVASIFGVSRQAIYNWQAGQPIAPENEARLEQLARAVDVLRREGFAGHRSLTRRKLPGGKTFVERVQQGADAEAVMHSLVAMIRDELAQRHAVAARLGQRPRKQLDRNDMGSPHLDTWS